MSLVNNIKWTSLSQLTRFSIQLATVFYLSRIIPPNQYGLVAIATVVMGLAYVFSDMGTAAAIIQKTKIKDSFISTVYTINLILGVLILSLILAISSALETYFTAPGLEDLLWVSATIFPIVSFSTTHKALLERQQKFKLIAMSEVYANIVSFIAVIVLANLNLGALAIIVQIWLAATITTILLIHNSKVSIRTHIRWKRADVEFLLSYSGNIFASHLLNYYSRNIDNIIIGKAFSLTTLGLYSIAYKLMMLPITNISNIIGRTFFPHISDRQRCIREKRSDFKNGIFYSLSIVGPAMAGLAFIAEDLVSLIFIAEWSGLGKLLEWLAPVAIIQTSLTLCGPVLMAYGKAKVLSLISLLGATAITIAMLVGASYDIVTLIKLYLISNIPTYIAATFTACNLLGISYIEFIILTFRALLPTLTMILGLSVLYDKINLVSTHLTLLVLITSGITFFSITFYLLNRKSINTKLKARES